MKKKITLLKVFMTLCLLLVGIANAWGGDVTYKFTPDAATSGNTSTSYVTTAYSFTYNDIGWSFNQWNPNTLQIKTNDNSATSEFNFKNTSAFPGKIKSVVITFSALTVSDASKLCFVGGTSAISSLSGGSAGTWNSTAKTLTWTPADGTNYTYFAFYQNGKAASGTNKLATSDAIVITYETAADPTEPYLSVSPTTIDFGTVYQKYDVAPQYVTVTFSNLTADDVEANTNDLTVFEIDKYGSFTSGDKITITPNTYYLGNYEETLILFSEANNLEERVTITMKVETPPVVETYKKVTNISDLAEGDIIVLASSTTAYGTEPGEGHKYIDATKFADSKSASLTGNVLKAADAFELTLGKSGNNWTMTNDNRLVGTTGATTMTFGNNTTATNTWSISIDGSANASISSTNSSYGKIQYNSSSPRFLNYTSSQTAIQIYKKEVPPTNEAVTFAAPEGGTLVIKNGENPIASGATIQNGTVLDVTFGMTPAEAYKDVALKVTKTDGGEDVTEKVYNATTKKITMPRYAITVAVTFTKLYKISLVKAGDGTGTATMNGVTTDIYVDGETQIDLVANAVAPNEFTSWSATDNIEINEVNKAETYAYASGDGTITATFGRSTLLPLGTPTLSEPTNITYSGVTLNWESLANAVAYNVELLLNDETVDSKVITGETSWTPEVELEANTTYTYTVQGVGDGITYAENNNPKTQSTVTTADYPAATLTLSENGITRDIVGKLNTPIDLPTTSTQTCDDKVFVGWSATTIDGETDEEPSLLGETYTFTNPEQLTATIYAVYATKQERDEGYVKVTTIADLADGKYLIVYETETGGRAFNGLDAANDYVEVEISNGKITDANGAAIIEIAAMTGGYSLKITNGDKAGNYISGKSGDNVIVYGATAVANEITISDGAATIESNSASFRYNAASGNNRFRFYKTTTTGNSYIVPALYKKTQSTTYSKFCTYLPAKVTITAAKYATLGLPYAVTIPDDVSAYTATVSDNTVTLSKINKSEGGSNVIPANCGVILYAEAGDYKFTPTTNVDPIEGNKLVAVIGETYTCTSDYGKVYYLGTDSNGKATFKKLNVNGTIAKGKAYLKLDAALSEGAKLEVTFDGEPTGIKNHQPSTINHQSSQYNLNGMRVNGSYKGIVIMNGKKYINK